MIDEPKGGNDPRNQNKRFSLSPLTWLPASRRAGLMAASATTIIVMGCMSLSFGGKYYECPCKNDPNHACMYNDGILTQNGVTVLKSGMEQTIYYPMPYASTPNLVVNRVDDCQIIEQTPVCFRIKNLSEFSIPINWTARGVPIAPPVTNMAPTIESPPPATLELHTPRPLPPQQEENG